MSINTLINILKDHGMKVVNCSADKIGVTAVYCKDGVAFEQEETIVANKQAVYDWLGY